MRTRSIADSKADETKYEAESNEKNEVERKAFEENALRGRLGM